MPPLIQAVVFDCGGVLTLPPPRREIAELAALCGLGRKRFLREWRRARPGYDRGTLEAAAYWAGVLAASGRSLEPTLLRELIQRDFATWSRADEAVLSWARELARAGVKTAILSNMPRDLLERMRRQLPWFEEFPVRVFSCEVALIKPEERIFRTCLQALQVEPNRALFVDDHLPNVRAARRLGMPAVRFRTIGSLRRAARRRGVRWGSAR